MGVDKPRPREIIAREVAYALNLPYDNYRTGPTQRLVGIIIDVVVNALKKGETVRIAGFGTFGPVIKASRKYYCPVRHKDVGDIVTQRTPPPFRGVRRTIIRPERKTIKFTPAKAFLRMINEN